MKSVSESCTIWGGWEKEVWSRKRRFNFNLMRVCVDLERRSFIFAFVEASKPVLEGPMRLAAV